MNILDKCPCLGCYDRTVGCHSSCEKYKIYLKESEERKKAIKKFLQKDTSYRDYNDDKIARLLKRKREHKK